MLRPYFFCVPIVTTTDDTAGIRTRDHPSPNPTLPNHPSPRASRAPTASAAAAGER